MKAIVWGIVPVAMIGAVFGIIGLSAVDSSTELQSAIAATLRYSPLEIDHRVPDGSLESSLDLIIVHGPPTGAARGYQLAILATMAGGIPAAVLAMCLMWLRERRRWGREATAFFTGGAIFQTAALILVGLVCALCVIGHIVFREFETREIMRTTVVSTMLLLDGIGLRCWLRLRANTLAVAPAPVLIT